ncbi:MAG: protein-disulfide reductase DsbD family protein [Akkermansiaceae bacterium]|nr:protein-disulfide reductase DsbD family protein [Akkermansiaceae bacterium]
MKVLSLSVCFFLFAYSACAQDDPELTGPGLEIGLISGTTGVAPGNPLTLGLHIHHLPGFHTYWKSPGIVGMATSIEWALPEGFTVSEIRWPYPQNTFMAKYPCHGYERDVTLVVEITPPDEIAAKEVSFKAKSAWMCCAKGCFPGFKTFELTLPVTDNPKPIPSAKAHLSKAIRELPSKNHDIKGILKSRPDKKMITLSFQGDFKRPLEEAYFFSSDGQISSDQKQNFVEEKDGSITLEIARSEFSPEGKTTIPGVLKIGGCYLEIEAKPKP